MARRISLEPHLTTDELEGRYRSTKDPAERSRWHFLWLLARGLAAKVIASITGSSASWIGRIARRYNERGPNGVKDLRHQSRPSAPLLTVAQQDELVAALAAGGALGWANDRRLDQPAVRPTRRLPTWLDLPSALGCPVAGVTSLRNGSRQTRSFVFLLFGFLVLVLLHKFGCVF